MRSQVRKMLSDNLSIEFRIMSACPIFWIKLPMFFKSYIRHNLSGTLCKKVKIHPSEIHILLSLTAKFLCLLMNLSKQMQRNRKSWNWQGECSTCQKKSEANCMEMCESQKQLRRWCQHIHRLGFQTLHFGMMYYILLYVRYFLKIYEEMIFL